METWFSRFWLKKQTKTRTTRMPAFWGYPPAASWLYPYYWVILDPKSKEGKVKVTNLKNSSKFQSFLILKQTLHATHLLKLLDKMCKYEMDPMGIVEDIEQTRFLSTDGQTDRRTDGPVYPPFNFVKTGGITRTPVFWGCPPAALWLPILLIHIGSQVKRRQSKLRI